MIKLIATDMDGTWLSDQKTYDVDLFLREFKIMQEKNIKFVVASGNQYENLLARFPQVQDKIYYVAENGALVAYGHKLLHTTTLEEKDLAVLTDLTKKYPYKAVASGLKSAYVREKDGQGYANELMKYFAKIKLVKDLAQIDDQVFKVTFDLEETELPKVLAKLQKEYPDLGFVAGSTGSIDMSLKGMNKAEGLKYLGKKLNIKPEEMVTFGDSGNDVGMLEYAGKSYATKLAMDNAKKAANEVIGLSNDSAVQKKIWDLLHN